VRRGCLTCLGRKVDAYQKVAIIIVPSLCGYALGSSILSSVYIHSIEVEQEGEDRFGQLKGGILDIEAVMVPVKGPIRHASHMQYALYQDLAINLIFDEFDEKGPKHPEGYSYNFWEQYPEAYSWLPVRLAVFIMETTIARVTKAKRLKNPDRDLWPITKSEHKEMPMFYGIVIEKLEKDDSGQGELWKRIGAFMSLEPRVKSAFDIEKQEKRQVKII
jgi:hypothetical protein